MNTYICCYKTAYKMLSKLLMCMCSFLILLIIYIMFIITLFLCCTYSGCPTNIDIWNIEWPLTHVGNTSSQSCPDSQGKQIILLQLACYTSL